MNPTLSVADYINKFFPDFEPLLKEKLIDNCSVKEFSAGEVIMQTGQYFRSTMIIVEGRVKLYRNGEEGNEFFMYYIQPGEACALSMVCAAKQEVSEIMARAEEDSVVLLLPLNLMDQLIRDFKSWYYFVMSTYRSRYEELLSVIDHVVFKAMDERLDFYLKNQYEKLGSRMLKITHSEIAADLNSSREVISRLLKKMEQKGDLILHRNTIEWLK